MAQAHGAIGSTPNTRRAPNVHSDAVQEAKRQEKMQSHSSSHRSAGATTGPSAQAGDTAN